MGSKQSTSTKNELLNDTKFKTVINKTSKFLNEVTAKAIQDNLVRSAASAKATQTIKITNLVSKGDIVISGVSQDVNVSINVSALADNKMRDELAQDLTGQLQTKLDSLAKATQEQLQNQGEQIFADIVGGLKDSLISLGSSLTGGKVTSKTDNSIKNLLQIDNETDLTNIIQQAVNVETVNKCVTDVASTFLGEQEQEISNITSTSGSIQVTELSQKIVSEQLTSAVSKTDLSSSIISSVSGIDKTDITNASQSEQTTSKKDEGTIEAAGTAASSVIESTGKILGMSMGIFAIVIIAILIGFIILIWIFRKVIGSIAMNKTGTPVPPERPMPPIPMEESQRHETPTGGGYKYSSIHSMSPSMMSDDVNTYNMRSGMLFFLFIICVVIAVVLWGILSATKKKMYYQQQQENFNIETAKGIKLNGLYMTMKNGGYMGLKEGTEDIIDIKTKDTMKFNITIKRGINGSDHILNISSNGKWMMLDDKSKQIKIIPYSIANRDSFDIMFTKIEGGDDEYLLSTKDGKTWIGTDTKNIILVNNKALATPIKFTPEEKK